MTAKSRADLTTQINVIRDETALKANTAERVGAAFQDVLDSVATIETPDGALVSAPNLVLDRSVWLGTSGSNVSIGRLPANCYGDLAVARRIVNSTTPATKVTLVHWGDSRSANAYAQVSAYGIPWGGHTLTFNKYTDQTAWTTTIYTATTTAVADRLGGTIGEYSPVGLHSSAFHAFATPAGSNDRTTYAPAFANASYPASVAQINGRPGYGRLFVRQGPDGCAAGKMQCWLRGAAYVKTWATPIQGYHATPRTALFTATIPNTWDYVADPTVNFEVGGVAGQTHVEGTYLDTLLISYFESDIGATHVNMSVGGRTLDEFLDDTIWDPSIWTDCVSQMSGEKILWLSLGTNGTGNTPTLRETFLAKLKTAVNEFRAVFPDGLVVCDTAYHANTEPGWMPARIRAMIDLAEQVDGVLTVDTANELGGFSDLLAVGWYTAGDYVHMNTTGAPYYSAAFADLVARCASV